MLIPALANIIRRGSVFDRVAWYIGSGKYRLALTRAVNLREYFEKYQNTCFCSKNLANV